jgi:hypothetical protein
VSDESSDENSSGTAPERTKEGLFVESGNKGGMTKHQAQRRSTLRAWLFSDPITEAWKRSLLAKVEEGDEGIIRWVGDHLLAKAPAAPEDNDALRDSGRPLAGKTGDEILAALRAKGEAFKP